MNNPEIANNIQTGNYNTNFHDLGEGENIIFIHGSGPGVSAWANWRLCLPTMSEKFRVIAPDMAGFGFTERLKNDTYSMQKWMEQIILLMDGLDIQKTHLVGNSFGGGLAVALAIAYPQRFDKMVLMGAVGVPFVLTDGLDKVWGYEPSLSNMKALLDVFAYDRSLVNDELANLRYQASIQDGFQESFSSMFPAPRQQWVDAMTSHEEDIKKIPHETLIIHGREDKVIPVENSLTLNQWIQKSQLHIFGECGHWSQIEHTKRFNNLMLNFFSE